MTNDELGEYKLLLISDFANVVSGGTPDTFNIDYWDGGIQWFTPSEIGKTKYVTTSKRTITTLGLNKSSAKLIPANSILFSSRATIGEISINMTECTTNQGFQTIVPLDAQLLDYLYYSLMFNKNKFLKKSSGSTFLEINRTDVASTRLKSYSNDKNKDIGNLLSQIDNLIMQSNTKIIHIDKLKNRVHYDLYNSISPKRYDLLKNQTELRRGSFPQPYGESKWYNGENSMPFIQVVDVQENMTVSNVTKQRISTLAMNKSVFVTKGSIIATIQGSIGRVAELKDDSYIDRTIVVFSDLKLNKEYFKYEFKRILNIEKQFATGGTLKSLTKEKLQNFELLIPDIENQIKIGKILSQMDNFVDKDKLRVIFNLLLYKLIAYFITYLSKFFVITLK